MEVAMKAGRLLLENGAEIFRVEETMERICRYYHVENPSFFVLSNGIFMTGGGGVPGGRHFAHVEHIPVKGAQLDRVVAVNQLSREIEGGRCTLSEADACLNAIARMPGKKRWQQILASGVGSACFCILFGGSGMDSAASFLAGLLLYAYVLLLSAPYMSRMIGNVLGGVLASAACVALYALGLGDDLSHMIIGAIIPLIPGIPFTNGIRDLADGDYISGSVRLLDALVTFLCIATGVGVVIALYHSMTGGGLL
ncbi:MAG: threonine/serine exporter family protein [Clostridiales bacterium]|nr:threonine/serine exporter family protein [Clostridiales bacterium]MDY3764235.1 threonine/serine exporter family protein [Candidatus Ventricola sp.]MCI6587672.1 threonine/serine exporter family protein [Clostridiales bacterium]MCI7703039.1 threonine/serine exporter family protein [Clostridiales bacterium]MDY3831268.1 threonine/serine exporter family protein [Candidatus Ventricola sp.]